MPYEVQVDWAPSYELSTSLLTYLKFRRHAQTLDLPTDWADQIRARSGDQLTQAPGNDSLDVDGLDLLTWQCPGDRTTEGVLAWIKGLSPADISDRLMPYVPDNLRGELGNLSNLRDRWLRAAELWDRLYFRSLDPTICRGLRADAAAKRELLDRLAPEDLIEVATGGIRLEPTAEVHRIVLIPQYHFRPLNAYTLYRGMTFYHYPVDALPTAPGEVPPAVARLTRALADAGRLQILRYLADRPRGFKDIVQFSGLAKSTVHHHLVALRAAGLVRVHPQSAAIDHYSLRPDALERLGTCLVSFIKGE